MHNHIDDAFEIILGILVLMIGVPILMYVEAQLLNMSKYGFNTLREPSLITSISTTEPVIAPMDKAQLLTLPYVSANKTKVKLDLSHTEFIEYDYSNRTDAMQKIFERYKSIDSNWYNFSIISTDDGSVLLFEEVG